MALAEFIGRHAREGLLGWEEQALASKQYGLDLGEVERGVLECGVMPARYQRNRKMITVEEQLRLCCSRVAVIGCGGLGGYIIEGLARLGVGHIVAIDPDVFEEHNLNRQLLASPGSLGRSKVEQAAARVAEINPAVTLYPVQEAFGEDNGERLLKGCSAAVDGLDNIPARQALAQCCFGMGIALIHGAIAGWYGQVSTQMPGDDSLQQLFARLASAKGVEQELGNPSFTPALLASLEVAEVCKVLLDKGSVLRGRTLMIDLLDMEFHETIL